MAEKTRESIEKAIRELSLQIRKEKLEQQQRGQTQRLNLVLCDQMLYEWSKLAKYYEDSIYLQDNPDTEMSLFIVANYLEWTDTLRSFLETAHQQNDEDEDQLDELSMSLEAHMNDILKAILSIDSLRL